jgi:hypothetical protein
MIRHRTDRVLCSIAPGPWDMGGDSSPPARAGHHDINASGSSRKTTDRRKLRRPRHALVAE